MTTVITRYFESAATAHKVRDELVDFKRLPSGIVSVLEDAELLAGVAKSGGMAQETADAYAERLKGGGAVVVVAAGYKPLGVANITRETMAEMGAAEMGDLVEEMRVKGDTSVVSGALNRAHIVTRPLGAKRATHYMANWPIPLLSRRKPYRGSLIRRNAFMADKPIPHIWRRKPYSDSIYVDKHQRMAQWPIGLLVPRAKKFFAQFPFDHLIPGHKFQAGFPFAHLIPGHKFQAKFPFAHLVPGHPRMARWPFPLLMSDKQGENALVPGHKFMAKFPIDHLIPGHKYQAGFPIGHLVPGHRYMAKFPFAHIVPGHRYMAKFPFAHIVPGHKYMAKFPFAHIVPGHKYMANFPFGHIIPGHPYMAKVIPHIIRRA